MSYRRKRLVLYVLCLVFLPVLASGGVLFADFQELKENVRQQLRIEGTPALPDSEMTDFCNRALLWVSTDIGGIESRFQVNTAIDSPFYAMPDTIVEILHATLISGLTTKSIKAMWPQYYEELDNPTELAIEAGSVDDVPIAYIYWDDTLQLIPIPVKVDSIYFYVMVEHPVLTDTMTIRMESPYSEAALWYACKIILESMSITATAAIYERTYDKARPILRERFRRKFEILTERQE